MPTRSRQPVEEVFDEFDEMHMSGLSCVSFRLEDSASYVDVVVEQYEDVPYRWPTCVLIGPMTGSAR